MNMRSRVERAWAEFDQAVREPSSVEALRGLQRWVGETVPTVSARAREKLGDCSALFVRTPIAQLPTHRDALAEIGRRCRIQATRRPHDPAALCAFAERTSAYLSTFVLLDDVCEQCQYDLVASMGASGLVLECMGVGHQYRLLNPHLGVLALSPVAAPGGEELRPAIHAEVAALPALRDRMLIRPESEVGA